MAGKSFQGPKAGYRLRFDETDIPATWFYVVGVRDGRGMIDSVREGGHAGGSGTSDLTW